MTKIKLATEKFVYDLTGVSSITTKPESKVVNGETLYRMCTKDGLTIFNAALDICPNHDKHEDNWLVPADYIFSLVVETPEIEINVYPRVHFAGYLEISGDIRVTYGKLPVGTYHLRTHAGGEYFPQSDTFDVDDSFEYTTFNFPRSSSTVDQNYYLKDISLYYANDGGLYLKADCNIV